MTFFDFLGVLLIVASTAAVVLAFCLLTTPPTSVGRYFLQWLGGHILRFFGLEEEAKDHRA